VVVQAREADAALAKRMLVLFSESLCAKASYEEARVMALSLADKVAVSEEAPSSPPPATRSPAPPTSCTSSEETDPASVSVEEDTEQDNTPPASEPTLSMPPAVDAPAAAPAQAQQPSWQNANYTTGGTFSYHHMPRHALYKCVRCLADDRRVVFLPCNHLALCRRCDDLSISVRERQCCLCQGLIEKRLHVYLE